MPQLAPKEDGSLVGIRAGGHNAFHCDPAGKILRQFDFDLSGTELDGKTWQSGLRGMDAEFVDPIYYFLFQSTEYNESFLMRVTPQGRMVNFSPTPFPADGISVTDRYLLLFERSTGKAQMYKVN